MACACGCGGSCGSQYCGKPGKDAGRPGVEQLRAEVARLEAELAGRAPASG
jgi:hypothetical protein